MVETVERAIYEMGVKGSEQITAAGRALDGLAVSQEKIGKATRNTTASFERMQASYDPQIRAVQRMDAEFERLARHVADGIGSSAQQSRILDSIVAKYDAQAAAINRAAVAHENLRRQQANATGSAGGVSAPQLIGAQLSSVSVRDYAEQFEQAAAEQDRMIASAKSVKATVDPLGTAFQKLSADVAHFNKLQKEGLLTQQQVATASALSIKRYEDVAQSLRHAGTAGRVASGEIVNLTYQLNDVVTGLALGQSPFMILAQQGGQVFQIFQNSKGGIVDFAKEIGSRFAGILTAGRLAFGGIAASVGVAALALSGYLDAQRKVSMAMIGAGRASGSTVGSIENIANQGASAFGLSVSEARDLAASLASTGKVANDNILPIVKMGKDIQHAFGIEATEAVKMLAESFADPARGAEQLNARLGFLDAAMQRQISTLVAQNRTWEAQRILTVATSQSLKDVSGVVADSTKFWTLLGNSISNAWDATGEFIARQLSLKNLGADEEVKKATDALARLEAMRARMKPGADQSGINQAIDREIQKRDAATAALQRYSQVTLEAQQRQFSFAQAAAIRNELPEIDAIERLTNAQELLVKTMIDVQTSGGPASDILKRIGLSYEQLGSAVATASGNLKSFKTEFQAQSAARDIANRSITAFSPSQKGEIARQQSIESTVNARMEPAQKEILAEQARANAIKQVTTALSEQARQRALTGNQSADSIRLEIDLIGKTLGQQAEMRANLQAQQQIEQEASQNRTRFDDAQFERLKKINAEIGRRTQMLALAALNDNIKFGAATSLLSPEDVAIAQQLRGVYPDVATALDSVEASGLRTNAALSGLSASLSGTLATGLTDIAMGSKSVGDGFSDMAITISRAIEEMIIKVAIVTPLMRGLQAAISGSGFSLGSLFGGGASEAGALASGIMPVARGAAFAGGNVVPFAAGGVVSRPTLFPMANGTGLMGEAGPEAVMPLRRGSDGKLGVAASGGASAAPQVTVNLIENSSRAGQTEQSSNGNGGLDLTVYVDSITAKNAANPGSATSAVLDNRKRVARR